MSSDLLDLLIFNNILSENMQTHRAVKALSVNLGRICILRLSLSQSRAISFCKILVLMENTGMLEG